MLVVLKLSLCFQTDLVLYALRWSGVLQGAEGSQGVKMWQGRRKKGRPIGLAWMTLNKSLTWTGRGGQLLRASRQLSCLGSGL